MKRPLALFWTFFWISSVTLGGGMAMLPLLEREFVDKRRWMSPEEMLDVVAVMQSLPGLIVINMAVLTGYRICGWRGALAAAFGAVLTPFAAIAVLAHCMSQLSGHPGLDHAFLGVRAGTAALIMMSLAKMARSSLSGPLAWTLAAASFIAAVVVQIDLTFVVLGGLAVGVAMALAGIWRKRKA